MDPTMFSYARLSSIIKNAFNELPDAMQPYKEMFLSILNEQLQKAFSEAKLVTKDQWEQQSRLLASAIETMKALEERITQLEQHL